MSRTGLTGYWSHKRVEIRVSMRYVDSHPNRSEPHWSDPTPYNPLLNQAYPDWQSLRCKTIDIQTLSPRTHTHTHISICVCACMWEMYFSYDIREEISSTSRNYHCLGSYIYRGIYFIRTPELNLYCSRSNLIFSHIIM